MTNLGISEQLPDEGRLFENNCNWGNQWLIIDTVGTTSNRDGIGARITVEADGHSQVRQIASGSSSISQNMLPVHFGLGEASKVDYIEIRWPSGIVQTLSDIAANQRLTVTEPQ